MKYVIEPLWRLLVLISLYYWKFLTGGVSFFWNFSFTKAKQEFDDCQHHDDIETKLMMTFSAVAMAIGLFTVIGAIIAAWN